METTIRQLSRLIGFAGITSLAFLEYVAGIAWRRNCAARAERQSLWLHRQCRRLARLLRMRLEARGRSDTAPLVVSNHVSYLDIIALGAISPVRFVAKAEVRQWPWLGWLAGCAGTIFLRRGNHGSLLSAMQRVRVAVQQGTRVVMFLEGASTDGSRVLPFHSALLSVAVEEPWPVSPAWIGYELPNGDKAEEVGWWGEMALLPHLWRLFGYEEIIATVRFGRVIRHWERKVLADELHHAVCDLAGRRPSSRRNALAFPKPVLLNMDPIAEGANRSCSFQEFGKGVGSSEGVSVVVSADAGS